MRNDTVLRRQSRSEADRDELASRIGRALPRDGRLEIQPGLFLHRASAPGEAAHAVLEPALCVIAQGSKDLLVADVRFHYDPAHYLITTMGLPAIAQIVEASPDQPFLSLRMQLDPALVTSVMVESGVVHPRDNGDKVPAVDVSPMDADLLDATLRLVRIAAATPAEYRVLARLVVREIVYRLLTGAQGSRLRQVATLGGHDHRMVRAVKRLTDHYDKPLRVEDVAAELGMSVSGFHAHFKAVTAMSPLQFQKQIRLQEARRLMLAENLDAGEAGYRVGYDDQSHFSREYKKHFGRPPMRDVEQMRELATA
jgi:AraC-like DNA-binding protein